MAQSTRAQLETLKDSLIRSGGSGGKTSAADVRDMITELIDSLANILDDADENEGYLAIDSNGRVDVTKITSVDSNASTQVLHGDGSWGNMHTGRREFNGDGVTLTFQVTHNCGFTPTVVIVSPFGADGAGDFYTTNYTTTTFDVVYLVAPTVGANNVKINFAAY